MIYIRHFILWFMMLVCCSSFIVIPALAFTANSLNITIDKNGDAVATFRFTLEGIIENTLPQSMLEEELKKGLTTSTEPPELLSMDRSSAVLFLKKFADTSDVPTGTNYLTETMDFKKAEIALQNSAISGAVTADFSPEIISLTFPDSYEREFGNVDVLPAVAHIVEDPVKIAAAQAAASAQEGTTPVALLTAAPDVTGAMNVTSTPPDVEVYIDSRYAGTAPLVFPDIAPGTHSVEFRKEGFEPVSENVTIITGKTTNVMVVLEYIPPAIQETFPGPGPALPFLVILIIAITGGAIYYRTMQQKKKQDDGEAKEGNKKEEEPEKIENSW
jgi:hypothetical protein